MIKNYILAVMLSCAAASSFGQMKNFTMFPGTATVDGVKDAGYVEMQDISNCINLTSNACGVIPAGTGCINAAKFSVMSDLEAIYVIVEVKDATPSGMGDGIDVFMSMDDNRTSNCPANWPRAYNASTFQLEFKAPELMKATSPNGQAGTIGSFKSVTSADGYTVEFSLLYGEMDFLSNLKVVEGRKIGFDIAVNQNAKAGDVERIAQSMWNASGQDRNWTEATNFGTLTIPLLGTSVNSLNSLVNSVTIAPNPAANQVSVVINAKQQDEVAISIINTLSQKVYSNTQAVIAGQSKHEISTSELPNGIYTVVISKGNLSTTEKLVINK